MFPYKVHVELKVYTILEVDINRLSQSMLQYDKDNVAYSIVVHVHIETFLPYRRRIVVSKSYPMWKRSVTKSMSPYFHKIQESIYFYPIPRQVQPFVDMPLRRHVFPKGEQTLHNCLCLAPPTSLYHKNPSLWKSNFCEIFRRLQSPRVASKVKQRKVS